MDVQHVRSIVACGAAFGFALLVLRHTRNNPRELRHKKDRKEVLAEKIAQLKSQTVCDILRRELYAGIDPFKASDLSYQDWSYPMSSLKPELVNAVLQFTQGPALWVELGSYVGNSAITTAAAVKAAGFKTCVMCIDTWCGDANMWVWHRHQQMGDLLKMDSTAALRIYECFLANVSARGHSDLILPLRVSSIVGLHVIERLIAEKRLSVNPNVIYLDSAHEAGETLLELQRAWAVLGNGGVLFGDDWKWRAVREDVKIFVSNLGLEHLSSETVLHFQGVAEEEHVEQVLPGLLIIGPPKTDRQWLVIKSVSAIAGLPEGGAV